MPSETAKNAFETYVEEILLTKGGWKSGTKAEWDKDRALFPSRMLAEQTAIATYLDEETAKLEALAAKVGEAMERLQEYRTVLITAAVTGKIDVQAIKR